MKANSIHLHSGSDWRGSSGSCTCCGNCQTIFAWLYTVDVKSNLVIRVYEFIRMHEFYLVKVKVWVMQLAAKFSAEAAKKAMASQVKLFFSSFALKI
jgi:hypothetical protein